MDCWSTLTEHLIEIFAEKLDSHRDFLSFGAVCTSWRSVFKNNIHRLPSKIPISHCLSKGKPFPLLVLYSVMDGKIHSLFSLSNKKKVKISHELDLSKTENKWIMGSWRGWLFVVDYITHEIAMINPLTGEEVCLPSYSSLSMYLVRMNNFISSYPPGNKDDCMVMFASNHSDICFCRVGDDKWNIHTHSHGIVNLINHNGNFYAIDTKSDLYRITMMEHTIDMQYVLVWDTFRNRGLFSRNFLVESSGELLLVIHAMANEHLDDIPQFEILKLTRRYFKHCGVYYLKRYEWQNIEDIGNRIIFLGHKGSVSVESSLYPGTKGNCIYFPHVINDNLHIAVYNLISWSTEYFSLDVDANLDGALWFSPNPW